MSQINKSCWAFLENQRANWLFCQLHVFLEFRTSERQSELGMQLLTVALTCKPCVCELIGYSTWNLSVPLGVCVEKAL